MVSRSNGRSSYGPGDTDVVGGRIAAQVIDMIVIFVLAVVVGVLFGLGLQSRGGIFLGIIVVTIAYGTVLEGAYGKTLGKMALGIRVVGPAGEDIDYGPAFLRNIPALFGSWLTWIVGIAAIAIDDQNQRLFDQFADTYVVRD
jgi:uncharacterized RDD family membrane protein YckC